MAFKDTISDTEVSGFLETNFFYNLGSSVGYGCPNMPNDVRLVQYFLNVHNEWWNWIFGSKIEVDGDFGGQTWGAIKRFQTNMGYNGYGTISTVKGNRYISPKTKVYYTIIYLNDAYKGVSPPAYWQNPRLDPNMPKELKEHLYGPLPQQV